MVVDFDGRILAQADPGPGEKVVVAPIDMASLRFARKRRRGHDMVSHFRSSAYSYFHQQGLMPAGDQTITKALNEKRIEEAKRRAWRDGFNPPEASA